MRRSDYGLVCRGCSFMREWGEKTEWIRESLGEVACGAYMCVHPERRSPVSVRFDDSPYNPCSSEGARTCPMK